MNRKANESLKEVRFRSKAQQVSLNKLKQSVNKWKSRCHALVLKCKGLQKIINTWKAPSLFTGSRYHANVRYLYYRLFAAGVTEAQANKVVRIVCDAFNVSLGPRLPCRRQLSLLKVESGEWSKVCVARLMAKAKDKDPTHFVVGKGRDGTGKNGWNFQVNTAHFQTEEGRASAAIGCSILPNKKATTQTAATQKVVQHIVALGDGLSDQDFRGVVSDCAANEFKTNKLEGNVVAAPCLMHCAVNTAKHGVAPTKTTAHVNCRCGTWDPPDGGDEVSWLCCPGCSTWVSPNARCVLWHAR